MTVVSRRRRTAPARPTRRLVRGMSLVEVLVSTVIFVIGVLGLLSAHASAFNSFTDAKLRIDAALLADRLIGELWVDRAHMAEYAYGGNSGTAPARIAPWLAQLQQSLPAGTAPARIAPWLAQLQQSLPAADASVEVVGEEVRVTVTWQPRDGDRRTHVAVATLQGP